MPHTQTPEQAADFKRDWYAYQPILAMTFVSILTAVVLHWNYAQLPFMPLFMGLWLVQFSVVKLFDVEGFASAFGKYDLISRRLDFYGYVFPFIQLALGLALLVSWRPSVISITMIIVSIAALVGVFIQLGKKEIVRYDYAGSIIRVPLVELALIEYGAMIVMAVIYFLSVNDNV